MNNIGTQMIETERLVLRKFVIEDAPDAFNNWYSDFEVVMWLQNNVHTDISQTKDYLTWFISSYEKLDFYRWAITLKNENIVIGSIGFTISSERDSVADLSYSLCKRFWNQGIITESLKSVLQYGLVQVGINRIEAFHATTNPASGKVLKKAGMKYEGHSRQKYKSHRGFEDCDLYAILQEDLIRTE